MIIILKTTTFLTPHSNLNLNKSMIFVKNLAYINMQIRLRIVVLKVQSN